MELFSYYKRYQKNMCAKSQVSGKDKTEKKKKKFNKGEPGDGFERVKSLFGLYLYS